MPLQTIEPRRLYRQIADQLRAAIERGDFVVGTRLPPERDLALQLGVSRPSVRMGSGIYVRAVDAAGVRAAAVAHEAESPLETIRARQLIEGELAAYAALHMRRPQIAGLREAIAVMDQEASAGHTPTTGDRLFHVRIAEASDNSVLLRLVGELFDERRNPLWKQLGSHFENARSWAAAIAEHRAVVEAIAHQSPQGAREAMATHLVNSHERFMASWQSEAAAAPPARKAAMRPAAKPARARRRVA
jgi:GntR family transcriptional regulator, transcriptional repressor for pyruvate dehydrogenase complex